MKSIVERANEEEVLKILVEQAPVGVCIMQDEKFCYVNSNFQVAIGYTVDELIGKDSLEIVVPEDREMVSENTIKMLKGELPLPYQFRVTCKDRSIIWVMATVKSIRYHGRRAVLGNYMEITGHKQIEDALKESEESYRELSNSITDVSFAMDEHLRYTYWNKASEILTGIRSEDALGKSIREIFPDKPWRRRAAKVYRDILRTQQPQIFVNDYDIDDRHYIFEISAYPSRGGISVFVRDITERKQAEKARREEEEGKSAFLEEAPVIIIHTDLKGKITYVNKRFELESGYSRGEITGKSGLQLDWFPANTTKYLIKRMADRLRGSPAEHWETQFKCKDGRWIWIELEGKILRRLGVPAGFQIIAMNITERKRAKETLQAEKNKLKSLVDAMEDTVTIQDTEYNIIYQNEPSRIASGGDQRGEKCYRAYEGRETICEDCPVKKAFKDGKSHTSERRKVISGKVAFWENTANPIRDAEGKIVSCLELTRDITERKKQEQALDDEATRRRLLIDQSLDGIVVLDVNAKVVEANQRFAEMLGYSLEEVRELHTWDWDKNFPPEEILEMGRNVDEKGLHLATKHTRKDGSVIDVDISISAAMCSGQKLIFCVCRDITDRKQAEEALRQSEEKYRTILEEMSDAYFEVDLGGHLTFANNSLYHDLGYSIEELMGMSYKDFTSDDDIEPVFRVFNEVYQTGVANKGFSWKTTRKDGSHGFAETSVSPIRDDEGKIIGFRGVGRDITERKKSEEKLRQSEERYKALFDSSVIGTLVLDAETMQVMMGNEAAMKIFGFNSLEEGACVNVLDFVPQDDRELNFELIKRELFEQDSRQTYDVRAVTKDGREIWINVTGVPMMYKGRLTGMVTFTDITERKQAEEALRQSEENYRALFDSSVIGTIVLDADTVRVAMANRAATEIFGFSSVEEIQGLDPLDYIRPEDKDRVVELALSNLLAQDSRQVYELGAFTKDGREIWISATGAKIMHEGKLAGLISFTDITEQKKQSEHIILTDRLASLGELASGTAHELNNPLTSIIGFSQLLMEGEVPDDIRDDLNLINYEAQRAASITKNLLTFARKHAPEKQSNQINSIVEDVLKLRAYEHKANSIEVERQFAPDLPEVMVDYFQMQQVFINIIINAEYFMTKEHGKGTLTITTKKNNRTVVISFADDGPGIPREILRRIFDPFFTSKESGKGTGLGLSICHGIVAEHGGQIYARNHQGKGATIVVELPINNH